MRLWLGLAMGLAAAAAAMPAEAQSRGDRPARLDRQRPDALKIPLAVDYDAEAARVRRGEIDPVERRARRDRQRADRVRLDPSPEQRLRDLPVVRGVRDGNQFGERSRLYLFAGSEDGSVGYNITRGDNGWERSGFSLDEGAFMGEAQAGVAWRRGDVQASFGYVRRDVDGRGRLNRGYEDDVVALQFSFTPGR